MTEFKAFQKGAIEKRIDELENLHLLAFQTALAGAHDKNGKPLYKDFNAMFDRKKHEDAMLGGFQKKGRVSEETIDNFKRSKEHAENLLNGISVSPKANYGEEDE